MKSFNKLALVFIPLFVFILSTHAQEGFKIGGGIGFPVGGSTAYYSYTLHGDLYYLWAIGDRINLGLTTGILVFLGEGNSDSSGWFESIPEAYIPIALAFRVKLVERLFTGLDLGYAFNLAGGGGDYNFDTGGGIYFKPVLNYYLSRKLALVASYSSVKEYEYASASVNFGVNIGFGKK